MNLENVNFTMHYDIIRNVLTDENSIVKCTNIVKDYEENQTDKPSKIELSRFSRHITLSEFFKSRSSATDAKTNMDGILEELSFNYSSDNSKANISNDNLSDEIDTVLVLQLSDLLDQLLNNISDADKKIYLYRYFFGYSKENVAALCHTSEQNVQKTLSTCNSKLKDLTAKDNLIADCKSVLLSFTDISDFHLGALVDSSSLKNTNKQISSEGEKRKKISLPICLNIFFGAIILALSGLFIAQVIENKKAEQASTNATKETSESDENAFNIESLFLYIDDMKKIVNTEMLLYYATNEQMPYHPQMPDTLEYTLGSYSCIYYRAALMEDISLKELKGEKIEEFNTTEGTFYKLLGTDSLAYMIFEYEDDYTLYTLSFPYVRDDMLALEEPAIELRETISDLYGIKHSTDLDAIYIYAADLLTGYNDQYTAKMIDDYGDLSRIYTEIVSSTFKGKTISELYNTNTMSWDYLYNNSYQLYIIGKDKTNISSLYYYPDGNFFFDGGNQLIFEPVNINGEKYLKEMLNYDLHKEEPRGADDWNFYLTCMDADEYFLTLNIQCALNSNNIGMYVGSDFTISKQVGDKWIPLTPLPEYEDTGNNPFNIGLDESAARSYVNFEITSKYKPLTKGTYRITVNLYDANSEDITNPNHKEFSADFVLDESIIPDDVIIHTNNYEYDESIIPDEEGIHINKYDDEE